MSLARHFYVLEICSTELVSFQLFPLRVTWLGVKIPVRANEDITCSYLVESYEELWLVLQHESYVIYVYRLYLESKL